MTRNKVITILVKVLLEMYLTHPIKLNWKIGNMHR